MKEKCKNILLRVKSKWRYFTNKEHKIIAPPENYRQVFEDTFTGELTEKWSLSQDWGSFHPEKTYQYYNENGQCAHNSLVGLRLLTLYNPKEIIKSELPEWKLKDPLMKALPDKFTIPNEIGLVKTNTSWKYGWFEATIKLPMGNDLWPAFWLTGMTSWPPEIDIFEAYSTDIGYKFDKRWFFKKRSNWNIQPNLHWGVEGESSREMLGGKAYPVRRATDVFIQYVVHWEKDFIKIYYGGNLVVEITDQEKLKWFNKENSDQRIILNNGTNKNFDQTHLSVMVVKNVKVFQR